MAKNSPTTKLFFALSMLVISVSAPTPIIPVIIFAVNTAVLLAVAKIPTRFYIHLLLYPTLALTLSCAILALFFGYGEPLTQVTFPWFTWTIYQNGITIAIATFLRVVGAISAQFFLVLTTSVTDIFIILRRIRVPTVLIETSLLIYRYIFVFIEIAEQMNTAQKLRLGHSSLLRKIRSVAMVAGNLFIRTLEQGERTVTAMNARGYDGTIRVLEDLPSPKKTALAGIALFDAALIISIYVMLNAGVV